MINPAAQTNKLETASPYLINTIPLVNNEISHVGGLRVQEHRQDRGDHLRERRRRHRLARRLQEVLRGGGRQDPRRRGGGVRPDQLSLDLAQGRVGEAGAGVHRRHPEPRGLRRAGRPDAGLPGRHRQHLLASVLRLPGDQGLVSHRDPVGHDARATSRSSMPSSAPRRWASSRANIPTRPTSSCRRSTACSARASRSPATPSRTRSSRSRPSSPASPRSPSRRTPRCVRSRSTGTATGARELVKFDAKM